MPIPLRSPEEINDIAAAGALFWSALHRAAAKLRPGQTTAHANELIAAELAQINATPILRGYTQGRSPSFPAIACISVNEQAVHAVPGPRILTDGDLVTIDTAAKLQGARGIWCLDAATSVALGTPAHRATALLLAARAVLDAAIQALQPGAPWATVTDAARRAASREGVRLLGNYSGHGIGRRLHEPPRLDLGPLKNPADERLILRPGMVFTIEPIVIEQTERVTKHVTKHVTDRVTEHVTTHATTRTADHQHPPAEVTTAPDGWTVSTTDNTWAAHEERMIALERSGPRILTR